MSAVSILLNAPRGLNEPVCCKSSSLSTSRPGTPKAPRSSSATVEGVGVSTDHWIGGERVGSTERFEDVSPIDEEVIGGVARGGAAEAHAAVAAARDAFAGWGKTAPKERAEVLHRIADGVEARVGDLAAVETRDNGSLLRSH